MSHKSSNYRHPSLTLDLLPAGETSALVCLCAALWTVPLLYSVHSPSPLFLPLPTLELLRFCQSRRGERAGGQPGMIEKQNRNSSRARGAGSDVLQEKFVKSVLQLELARVRLYM